MNFKGFRPRTPRQTIRLEIPYSLLPFSPFNSLIFPIFGLIKIFHHFHLPLFSHFEIILVCSGPWEYSRNLELVETVFLELTIFPNSENFVLFGDLGWIRPAPFRSGSGSGPARLDTRFVPGSEPNPRR